MAVGVRIQLLVGVVLIMVAHAPQAGAAYRYPFQDPDLPIEQRVENAVSLMTLDDKFALLGWRAHIRHLGIRATSHEEGLHGLSLGGPRLQGGMWGRRAHIPTTTFPQAIGMAETWDPDLVRRAAAAEGYEARYVAQNRQYEQHALVIRAPNADLGRDPRWGRTEECFGEDPYLAGTMTVAFVKGLQGDHPRYWQTAALLKHFLANSNEDGRNSSSSDFDERLLREYYAVPFRMGIVEGGARAYMAAYNAYNGIPCTVHPILKDITMAEWGMDGVISTDGGALRLLVTDHKYYPDIAEAVAGCIRAGINYFLDRYDDGLDDALERGLLTESDLDEPVKGTLRVMIRLGLLDPPELVPYSEIGTGEEPWNGQAHKNLAREVTRRSVVLLKNADDVLPLDRATVGSIAVVGPRADEVLLDWYSGLPPYTVTPLEGIRNAAGGEVEVIAAADESDEAAVEAARSADVAVVCVGNHPTGDAGWAEVVVPSDGKEAVDRKSITLEQEELVKKVFGANPNTVLVLVSSFPFAINWSQENVPAIVHMTHGSQEMGNGLADVLFGDVAPGGRLVQTWPRSLDQLPDMMDYDIRNGRTYMYFRGEPLYPFGHGLSYTTFEYGNLRVSSDSVPADGEASVSVDVRNTGERAGDEVVQMYVRHLDSAVERPAKELKGFRRISLAPGEVRTVEVPLAARSLAHWDAGEGRFVVEADTVATMLGSSSADIRLEATVSVGR
jgi:beta-glucosidase